MRRRINYLQIPSVLELGKTLEREVKREVPLSKINTRYADVICLQKLLDFFGQDEISLRMDISWEDALVQGEELLKRLLPVILNENSENFKSLAIEIYRYLAEEDVVEDSELIIAFGARTLSRAEKAVTLYKEGFAAKLLFSGKGPTFVDKVEITEAERFFDYAISKGVSKNAIILEKEAITLPDNVRRTLNLLDELNILYKRVILVNSPYMQRRASGYFKKYCSQNVAVLRVNCETKENLREDHWFLNEEGIRYVLGEYLKIWISLVTNTI